MPKKKDNPEIEKTKTYIIKKKKQNVPNRKGKTQPKTKVRQETKVSQETKVNSKIKVKSGENVNKPKKAKKAKKISKHPKLKRAIKIIMLLLVLSILIVGGIVVGWGYQILQDAKLGIEDLVIKYQNSVVKDINGNIIAELNGDENREIVTIAEMSEYLPIAFISIEDERYYEHFGVDIKRTGGAAVTYLLGGGSSSFGGSTITQQLVKNLTNEKEDTIKRKLTEMSRAYYLEKELSKDQILELYLNLIFLGGKAYGVEVASRYYFNKGSNELSLAECAFLAGINNSPNAYSPFKQDDEESVKKIKTRTKTVLNKMNELGKIKTKEEYKAALEEVENGLAFEQGKIAETNFSYHTDAAITQIIKELREQNDWSYETAKLYLFSSGFTIYTTQNPEIQSVMEEEFKNPKYVINSREYEGKTSQAGMVIIDHTTGYVLAACGGLGEKTDAFGLNRATQITKQTGSSMKPIAVLAPGIDKGIITAGTVFDDVQSTIGGTTFKNYGHSYRGLITMREAVAASQNIPFLRSMIALGPENSIEFLKTVGIDNLVEEDNNITLALGGLTIGTSPLKMAGAYAAIANDGEYIEPTFYTKVVDAEDNVILEAKQERRTVMSKSAAYVVKEMLTEAARSGTSTYCTISGMSVAAKTGTTNDDFDRWMCGFTPYYTAATWFGYDKAEEVKYNGSPANPAGGIWIGVMRPIHEALEGKTFASTRPEGVVQASICNVSGLLPTELCNNDPRGSRVYSEFFVRGTVPTKTCEAHVLLEVCSTSGLKVTEFCPSKTSRVCINRPESTSQASWQNARDGEYTIPAIGTCTIHTSSADIKPEITLVGSATINLNLNEEYKEQRSYC